MNHVWRSDVIGSLLRPPYLQSANEARERGEIAPAEFKRVEDRAVDEALALQEAAGLEVVTDGEMRRYAFYGHLVDALEGFDKYGGWSVTFRDDQGHEAPLRRPVVVDKLRWRRQMSVEEFTYLRGRSSRQVKVTLLSAQQAAAYYDPDKSRAAYGTRDAYLADLVDFTRREIAELARLGCTYVQIDAPQYAALLDEKIRETISSLLQREEPIPILIGTTTSRHTQTSRSRSEMKLSTRMRKRLLALSAIRSTNAKLPSIRRSLSTNLRQSGRSL